MKRVLSLTVFTALLLAMATSYSLAQRSWYRGNPRQVIRNLETDTDTFKKSLDHALDRSALNGTEREDEINNYVKEFEHATDKLKDRSEDQQYSPNLAREVLVRGRSINQFMRRHQMGGDAENDWIRVRGDLTQLAESYYIKWRW